jgi:hypothetical protein
MGNLGGETELWRSVYRGDRVATSLDFRAVNLLISYSCDNVCVEVHMVAEKFWMFYRLLIVCPTFDRS